jgi:signal transduction histidine kinase
MDKILAEAFGQDGAHLATEGQQRLLSRLLAHLAHEIRNPLSSLDIHVQLLEEDVEQLPAAQREAMAARLEIIHGELHRLENTVKHFLRLARPSELDPAPVDLVQLAKHVCDLLRPQAEGRHIELSTRVTGRVRPLLADGAQLTQALVNLVINGLQAVVEHGRVDVVVGSNLTGSQAVVEVRDTGAGFPADRLGAVFEPYYTTKQEGSGLGLWITQQIVMVHGGMLRASNAAEGGAVLTMTLPALPKESHGG